MHSLTLFSPPFPRARRSKKVPHGIMFSYAMSVNSLLTLIIFERVFTLSCFDACHSDLVGPLALDLATQVYLGAWGAWAKFIGPGSAASKLSCRG